MSEGSTLAKSASYLTIAELGGKALEFLALVFIAHFLSVAHFGLYSYVYTLGIFISLIPHFGVDQLIIRDISKYPNKSFSYFKYIGLLKVGLLLFSQIGLEIYLYLDSSLDTEIQWFIRLGFWSAASSTNIMFFTAFFRAKNQLNKEVLLRLGSALAIAILSIIVICLTQDLYSLMAFRFIGYIIATIMTMIIFISGEVKAQNHHNYIDFQWNILFTFVKMSWPFALNILFVFTYISIDTLMIHHLLGNDATGMYAAAVRILNIFLLLPSGGCNALLPHLSSSLNQRTEHCGYILALGAKYLYLLAIGLCAIIVVGGPQLLTGIFGVKYERAYDVLLILSFSLVFSFLGKLLQTSLLALGREKTILKWSIFGCSTNILLNFIWIPTSGIQGAAWATACTEALIVGMVTFSMYRYHRNLLNQCLSLYPLYFYGLFTITLVIISRYAFGIVESLIAFIFCTIFLFLSKGCRELDPILPSRWLTLRDHFTFFHLLEKPSYHERKSL